MHPSATLIYNPAAGAYNLQAVLPEIQAVWETRGWQVILRQTRQAGDIAHYASEAVQDGCQAVLVAGGDGSLNEAVNALALSPVALGVIPTGTGNVFARQIGVPIARPWNRHRLVAAALSLVEGRERTIDLGKANGRYFLLWSGVGLDAQVAQTIEPKPAIVRRFGLLGYAAHVVSVAIRFRGQHLIIEADEERIENDALICVASNTRAYAAILNIAPRAVLDDRRLDLTVLRGTNLATILLHAAFLLTHTVQHDPLTLIRQVQRIQVTSPVLCPLHVDGEPFGSTPASIEVVPSALKVLVPQKASERLFSQP